MPWVAPHWCSKTTKLTTPQISLPSKTSKAILKPRLGSRKEGRNEGMGMLVMHLLTLQSFKITKTKIKCSLKFEQRQLASRSGKLLCGRTIRLSWKASSRIRERCIQLFKRTQNEHRMTSSITWQGRRRGLFRPSEMSKSELRGYLEARMSRLHGSQPGEAWAPWSHQTSPSTRSQVQDLSRRTTMVWRSQQTSQLLSSSVIWEVIGRAETRLLNQEVTSQKWRSVASSPVPSARHEAKMTNRSTIATSSK